MTLFTHSSKITAFVFNLPVATRGPECYSSLPVKKPPKAKAAAHLA
jgi:hypothetical protein